MKPFVEELEPRCVLAALSPDPGAQPVLVSDPVAGSIHAAVRYDGLSDTGRDWSSGPFASWGPEGTHATNLSSGDGWVFAPALTQRMGFLPDGSWEWPQLVGAGQWDVFHGHWDDPNRLSISWATLQRFEIPNAESVGLLLHTDGSVTIYQQTPGLLWQTTTHDGLTWEPWSVTVSLANPPAPTEPATVPPFAFDYLDVPAGWGMEQPETPFPPHAVYGLIFADEDEVRVGFEWDGHRFAGVVREGVLSIEGVDEFWRLGEWKPEVEVWGLPA